MNTKMYGDYMRELMSMSGWLAEIEIKHLISTHLILIQNYKQLMALINTYEKDHDIWDIRNQRKL